MRIEKTSPTRPTKRALQVYLDSSDYSVLSEAMVNSGHPDAGIFLKLCQLVDQGRIEIRFSTVHVIEMAHLDPSSKKFAVSRAKCLQRLSNGKCFRFWLEMPVIECINILSDQPVFQNVTSNNGFWHPNFSETAVSLKQLLIDEFKKIAVENTANRQQRRALERRYFPNGRLGKEGIHLLQTERGKLLAVLSEEFPLSERFYRDDLMLQFASGRVGAQEIIDEMSVVFRDVEKFIAWTYDTRDKEQKLVSWLRDYGRDLVSRIEGLREELEKTVHPFVAASELRKRISDALEERLPALRLSRLAEMQSEAKKLDPLFDHSDSDWTKIRNSTLGSVPSLDVHIVSFFEHFRRNVQMNRKMKPSDLADLFHLVHLPYCDLFRTDGDAAEVAKRIAPSFNTLVVPKLRELPNRIDDALKRRATSV